MTPEQQKSVEDWLEDANASDAICVAAMLAVCNPHTSAKLSPEQKGDILRAAFDAIKVALYYELCEMIVSPLKDNTKVTANQIASRVGYAGAKSASEMEAKCRRFFTLCEMVKS